MAPQKGNSVSLSDFKQSSPGLWKKWLATVETPVSPCSSYDEACKDAWVTVKNPKKTPIIVLSHLRRLVARHIFFVSFQALWLVSPLVMGQGLGKFFYVLGSQIGILILLLIVEILCRLYNINFNWHSVEWKVFESIKVEEKDTYQNELVLKSLRSLPVAKLYPKPLLFQPLEGFCGYASLNNILASLPERSGAAKFVKLPACMQHITVEQMYALCHAVKDSGQFPQILNVAAITRTSYDEYMKHVELFNDKRYRYMACWHRSPLYFSSPKQIAEDPKIQRKKCIAAHWSPLASYDKKLDRILLLDVNSSYDEFAISPKRFYDTIYNRDFLTGAWRGFIRIEVAV